MVDSGLFCKKDRVAKHVLNHHLTQTGKTTCIKKCMFLHAFNIYTKHGEENKKEEQKKKNTA